MPYKPKRPCSFPGCPRLTNGQYCDEHQRIMNAKYERFNRSPDTRKKYGNHWKRIRDAFAQEHPYCQICGSPTQEIHHRIPLSEGGTNDWENLMALCKSCHARVHAQRGDRWHNK